jgi:hypothetical protein
MVGVILSSTSATGGCVGAWRAGWKIGAAGFAPELTLPPPLLLLFRPLLLEDEAEDELVVHNDEAVEQSSAPDDGLVDRECPPVFW